MVEDTIAVAPRHIDEMEQGLILVTGKYLDKLGYARSQSQVAAWYVEGEEAASEMGYEL